MAQLHLRDALREPRTGTFSKSDPAATQGHLRSTPRSTHQDHRWIRAKAAPDEPAVHGRWWRSELTPDLFHPYPVEEAEALIQAWADSPFLDEPGFKQPPEVQRSLTAIYELLASGSLYRLANPGKEAEHEYGFVTGSMGFHEFVVINRRIATMHVIVASDD